ncbi:MAG TPA: PEP-CTERM sorting domain-containing protein, partial [Tepidisphaeraceae bacterium]|nr:PEP-CTERM sorting domain-containing protein [Tepidisphaeraceae bacterium]
TTGDTVVDSGTMQLNNSAAATGTIFIGNGGSTATPATLNVGLSGLNIPNTIQTNIDAGGASNIRTIAGTYASGSSTISGPINVNGGLTIGATNAAATLAVTGAIADGADGSAGISHNVTINGGGNVLLSAANTYTGNTTVSSGTMTVDTTGSLASPNVTVASGATMNVNGALAPSANVTANGLAVFAGNHTANATLPIPLGTLNIGAGGIVRLADSDFAARPSVMQPGSLTIDAAGKLDVMNNEVVFPGTAGGALTMIQAGQIVSTESPADPSKALGYIDLSGADAGKVEVRYTLKGDTNLDGIVNVGDLGALATNYNITGGMSWANGDFTQDGTVNVADLGALATNYNNHLANGAASGAVAQSLAIVASGGGGATAVPEPGALSLVGLLASSLLTRRRARRS